MTLFEFSPIWYVGGHYHARKHSDFGFDRICDFDIRPMIASLCESGRVQRDLQFEEQVGQGPRCVRGIRCGSVIGVLHQIRRCEAQARRAQPDVLPIVDSQDARPDTGTGSLFPA